MKRTIKRIIITLSFGCLIMLLACGEGFLDKQPPGTPAGEVMETPEGVEGLLIGAYDMLTGDNIFGSCLGTDWVYGGVPSDNMYKGSSFGGCSPLHRFERWET